MWLLAFYIILLLCRPPWPVMDYIFSVLFHTCVEGAFLFAVLFAFYVASSIIIRLFGWIMPPGGAGRSGAALRKLNNFSDALGRLIFSIIALYGLLLIVAGLSQNAVFSLCVWAAAGLAGTAARRLLRRKQCRLAKIAAFSIVSAGAAALSVSLLTGVWATVYTAAAFTVYAAAACFFPSLFPTIRMTSLWKNVYDNKRPNLVVGLLMFVMYFTWIPNLNRTAGAPEYIANTRVGAGAGIIPVDGGRLVYLSKSRRTLNLFDGATLRVVGTAAMGGYPRQAVFDREKKLIYVVVFGIRSQQLKIVSLSPFRIIRNVSMPAKSLCHQAISVNVDYKHDRILVGCDFSGDIFFVDRRNPVMPKAPIWPGPSGKGIVRIEINERADRALTIGCLLGPFFNVIDLATGRISGAKFTGWLVWESAYDSATGRLFVTVPFRSVVPVVDERTLNVEHVIRSSFGARAIAVDTKNRRLFVGSQIASIIEIYDLDTLKLKKRFYLPSPRYFYYDETEHALYVAASRGLYKLKI
jgi:hypothetical protein